MAPNDKRDIQGERDIHGDVYQDLLAGVVDQKIVMLEWDATYEYDEHGDPLEEVLNIIRSDRWLKKDLAALQKDIAAVDGALSVDLQQRIFMFMQTVLYLVGERDKKAKKEEDKLMPRLEAISRKWYLCTNHRTNTVWIPVANIPDGVDGGIARMVLDQVCGIEWFPEDLRAETEKDIQRRQEEETRKEQQALVKREKAETTLGEIDTQINPYLNKNLEADRRIIDLQRIILSDHLKKERTELLAGLEVGHLDPKKVDKARKAIRARLKWWLYVKIPGDVAKLGSNIYEWAVKKPAKKPQKTFDLGAQEEEPTFDGTVTVPNKLKDEEVDKAIFTLPQVQSLVALELGRPFLEFLKTREQYVPLMEETALWDDVEGIPASQWFAQKVRWWDEEYRRWYLASINILSDMRLSWGAIAVYEDQQKKINALWFPGFVEGKDREHQPWTEYMLAVNKAVGGRFLLLGSAWEQSYGEYRSIDMATMRPVLGGKNLPTFKQLREEARERDDFFDLPGWDDGSPLNDLHDELEQKATGNTTQVETENLRDTRTWAARKRREENLRDSREADVRDIRERDRANSEEQHLRPVGERLGGTPIYDELDGENDADQDYTLAWWFQDSRFRPATGIVGVSRDPWAFVQWKPPVAQRRKTTGEQPDVVGDGQRRENNEEEVPWWKTTSPERHISKTEAMFSAEEGIQDFTKISLDKKLELRKHIMLHQPLDYAERVTLALETWQLDYACVVFGSFRYSADDRVKEAWGFDSTLEWDGIRRMKNAVKGKKIGIFYLNAKWWGRPQDWLKKKQIEIWATRTDATSVETGVTVVLWKDAPKRVKQRWQWNGVTWFIEWASESPPITPGQVEVGKQKDKTPEATWKDVQKETPTDLVRAGNYFTVVADAAWYQTYKNTMKEGEQVLMLWTDTEHPLRDDDLAKIVAHYKKQNVRVCYIPSAEKIPNISKTRIVQLADGSRKMKWPAYVLKTWEKDLYTLIAPYAVTMSMHNSWSEWAVQMAPMVAHYYTGDIWWAGRNELNAVKFTLNRFDLDLAQQRAKNAESAPK